MGAPAEISGFVLAGGRSSRLGRDKATLPWPPNAFAEGNRQTLLQHSVARLQTVCSTVSVCANRDDLPFAGTVIPDALPGSGPLGGIVAALEHTTTDWNLMLAVDLPFLPVEVLQALVGCARSREPTGIATNSVFLARGGLHPSAVGWISAAALRAISSCPCARASSGTAGREAQGSGCAAGSVRRSSIRTRGLSHRNVGRGCLRCDAAGNTRSQRVVPEHQHSRGLATGATTSFQIILSSKSPQLRLSSKEWQNTHPRRRSLSSPSNTCANGSATTSCWMT